MKNSLFSWNRFKGSFIYAWGGIWQLLKNEQNLWIILVLGAITIFFAFWYPLAAVEKSIVILASVSVLGAEILNTAMELICDKFHLENAYDIKIIKDIGAGFVLIWSFAALVVIALMFWPYIFK